MDDINRLIMNLSWDSSEEEKNRAIEKLLLIEDKDMHLLLQPHDKGVWDGAAEVITRLGYPKIKVILPGLLEWLQDMTWPGANQIAQLLGQLGDPIVPYVKAILKDHKGDGEWIEWLFEHIIDGWDKEKIAQIQEELLVISNGRVNDLKALSTFYKHNFIASEEFDRQLTIKRNGAIAELADLDKKYQKENKQYLSYCGNKSILQEYIKEIEELRRPI
ncbi:DUF5071 domain-containing protein [Paenibacillus kobensis]|uniref:DUF5071 domain-containing protein n=1 Tax=Paenibacillus kobensis TaxID=59841 RepID=UPI000FDB1D05|nr:DUF5071 domain-containing protein [Paenibacillus kobensis]